VNFEKIVDVALTAGKAVLRIYEKSEGMVVERKADNSPLTLADRESHRIIAEGLSHHGLGLPLLSEEGKAIPYEERSRWKSFWLVDPLDGTKEFISRNGEFTVNIALVEDGHPVAGVVYAPALDLLYYTGNSGEVFRKQGGGGTIRVKVDEEAKGGLVAVQSRSHPSEEEEGFLRARDVKRVIKIGSSLKFCLIAGGEAHLYPRFGPMMDWDMGAGHAVVERAGGSVRTWNGNPIRYNMESLKQEQGVVVSSTKGVS
jgi:3'(2'), 5'-bisphosphate nucleotidase